MMNFRLIKEKLYTDKRRCAEDACIKQGKESCFEQGYIYSCRQVKATKNGQSINNGYKSDEPVIITGCEYLKDVYTQ